MPPAGSRDYLGEPQMRTGESCLWILGHSRRWSTRRFRWVTHARPITAAQYQRRLGCPPKSNIITAKYRKDAINEIDQQYAYARMYDRGRDYPRRQVNLVPPTPQQSAEFNLKILKEQLARQNVINGVPGALVTDNIAVAPGTVIPPWEDIDGDFVDEQWDQNGSRSVNQHNTLTVPSYGTVASVFAAVNVPAPALALPPPPPPAPAAAASPSSASESIDTSNEGNNAVFGELRLSDKAFDWLTVIRIFTRQRAFEIGFKRASEWNDLAASGRRNILSFAVFQVFDIHRLPPNVRIYLMNKSDTWENLAVRSNKIDSDVDDDKTIVRVDDATIADFLEAELQQLDVPPANLSRQAIVQRERRMWLGEDDNVVDLEGLPEVDGVEEGEEWLLDESREEDEEEEEDDDEAMY